MGDRKSTSTFGVEAISNLFLLRDVRGTYPLLRTTEDIREAKIDYTWIKSVTKK